MTVRVLAAAAVLLVLTGCTATAPPAVPGTPAGFTAARPPAGGVPAVPLPRPAGVDRQDPDAVARAALTTLSTHDTAVDHGIGDAARRALPWLSGDFARDVLAAPPVAPPGATWSSWARHRAVVTSSLTTSHDDRPADTATTAYRQYIVERRPRGRDGWRGAPTRSVLFVRLSRTTVGWAVDQVLPR